MSFLLIFHSSDAQTQSYSHIFEKVQVIKEKCCKFSLQILEIFQKNFSWKREIRPFLIQASSSEHPIQIKISWLHFSTSYKRKMLQILQIIQKNFSWKREMRPFLIQASSSEHCKKMKSSWLHFSTSYKRKMLQILEIFLKKFSWKREMRPFLIQASSSEHPIKMKSSWLRFSTSYKRKMLQIFFTNVKNFSKKIFIKKRNKAISNSSYLFWACYENEKFMTSFFNKL
jgi:hypothetical protein